jgi:hypothetical protein
MQLPIRRPSRARNVIAALAALLFVPAMAVTAFAGDGQQSQINEIRRATNKYHDVEAAKKDGFAEFYMCTDENSGKGAMGQHYANVPRVLDPKLDPTEPEVLTYQPMPDGSLRLIGVEYVIFQQTWYDNGGVGKPRILGQEMNPLGGDNRYGLPPFFELHAWVWRPNPRGVFDDWNSKVTCRGNGDPA